MPEQIKQGAGVVCLADYFCLGLGGFCFWSLSCQYIQSLSKVIICLITQGPCCQVYIRDCSQAAGRAALQKPWILQENCSGKEQRSGMMSVGRWWGWLPSASFGSSLSGGPCSEPSERTFCVRYCCCLSLCLFRLCWVSFFRADSFNFESTFVSTLLCNQFPSFLHCEMLAVGTALHNELLRKAFRFLKTQPQRHVIYVSLQGRWLWMASQGVVSALPGFFSSFYSQGVMTVTETCNYVDFFHASHLGGFQFTFPSICPVSSALHRLLL